MTGYRIEKQAAQDLKEIWRTTTSNFSEKQADKYVAALKTGCRRIADYPAIGKLLKLTYKDIRLYHCEHHYIVYLTNDVEVVVIAFLHEKMDFVDRLKAGKYY